MYIYCIYGPWAACLHASVWLDVPRRPLPSHSHCSHRFVSPDFSVLSPLPSPLCCFNRQIAEKVAPKFSPKLSKLSLLMFQQQNKGSFLERMERDALKKVRTQRH